MPCGIRRLCDAGLRRVCVCRDLQRRTRAGRWSGNPAIPVPGIRGFAAPACAGCAFVEPREFHFAPGHRPDAPFGVPEPRLDRQLRMPWMEPVKGRYAPDDRFTATDRRQPASLSPKRTVRFARQATRRSPATRAWPGSVALRPRLAPGVRFGWRANRNARSGWRGGVRGIAGATDPLHRPNAGCPANRTREGRRLSAVKISR
jgi:hypothetical protein